MLQWIVKIDRYSHLLKPSASLHSPQFVSPLESALMQVFILKDFKSRKMNTYKKQGVGR